MALRDRLMEAMETLGLHGMKASFDDDTRQAKAAATPEKILCDLLETEMAERRKKHSLSHGTGEVPGG